MGALRAAMVKVQLPALVPALITVALMLLWAAHDGGFDADTWYWGALVLLAVVSCVVALRPSALGRLNAPTRLAIAMLATYVAWSYLSIAWAQAPGVALEGSNRALLYLIVFVLMSVLPWTAAAARVTLVVFALGVGVIAVVILLRLASADNVPSLIEGGRLRSPTGYFNSSAALFTIGALTSIALASRRELPGFVRGLLVGTACACLPLAIAAQSRGWLFTLPVVLVTALLIVPDRLRVVATAALPVIATTVSLHRVIAIFGAHSAPAVDQAARSAGGRALVLCVVMTVLATVLAWLERLRVPRSISARRRTTIGIALVSIAIVAGSAGAVRATHGAPLKFVKREWQGFSHVPTATARGSYFNTVGSGRYDFWRVALEAFTAHPIGGLGQDNFADYYVVRRRTQENPDWVHSFELRLLAHTGLVGFVLFASFLGAAFWAAIRARRRGLGAVRSIPGIAALASTVWLIHGSVDWFWELPALTAPALGFLAMAGAVVRSDTDPSLDADPTSSSARSRRQRMSPAWIRAARVASGTLVLIAATAVLTFPYLAVREVSMAADQERTNPTASLSDLKLASQLNPLGAEAGTRAGLLALANGQAAIAKRRFTESISREPGAWLGWLGAGLAESSLGERQQAASALHRAYAINNQQPPIKVALARLFSSHPLTYAQAVQLLVVAR